MNPQIPKSGNYIPAALDFSNWENILPYYTELEAREIQSGTGLEKWMKDWDELKEALEEHYTRLYIAITIDTTDTGALEAYTQLVSTIVPSSSAYEDRLQRKLLSSPFISTLNQEDFLPTIRKIKNDIEIFRAENLELLSQEQVLNNRYNEIRSSQTIEHEGQKISLAAASLLLKNKDRAIRKAVYEKMDAARRETTESLDKLLSELVTLRTQIAKNAGFSNYIEYKYAEWGRFDYSVQQANKLYDTIARLVTPLEIEKNETRRKKLNLEALQPWDLNVELTNRPPLTPSVNSEDLINKVITCFRQIDPSFAAGLERMKELNHLEIDSGVNKMKGVAYNVSLAQTGVPFILQDNNNAARDMTDLIHEGGHATHSLLNAGLEYSWFKSPPLEMAEVASHAMEFMTMGHWDIFYPVEEDLKQAKILELETVITYFGLWAIGESFQNWLYANPEHTVEERHNTWNALSQKFLDPNINYKGFEYAKSTSYQAILPVYSLPFYMAAYCFSQLGAISIWRNFKKDPQKTIAQYKAALSLGNKRKVPELYAAAGIEFEFSESYVQELMDFLQAELQKCMDLQ